MRFTLLFLFTSFVFFPYCKAQTISAQDSAALVAFYNAAGGVNTNLDWDFATPPHTWRGVSAGGGRVVGLRCVNANLTGNVLSALAPLTALVELDLRNNSLSGDLSPLGSLRFLQVLQLANNQFASIPQALSSLTNLRILDLAGNQLRGNFPTTIFSLRQLRELNLSGNQLDGNLPQGISALAQLNLLNLGANRFSGAIPVGLTRLSRLRELYLYSNSLQDSIPTEIGSLRNLQVFHAYKNQLEGAIPLGMSRISSLRDLQLHDNQLEGGLSAVISSWTRLEILYLQNNRILDAIPRTVGSLTRLREINLSNNRFRSSIPNEIEFWVDIEYINFSRNELSGNLPIRMYRFSKLRYLNLSLNAIGGGFFPDPDSLTSLTYLDLSSNQLIGNIPESLGGATSLTYLNLSNNDFNQINPLSLVSLVNLTYLNLSNNNFSIRLPSTLGNLNKLTYLDVSHNAMTGPPPNTLGNMSELVQLRLNHNRFGPTLPATLNNLEKLTTLTLENNLFEDLPSLDSLRGQLNTFTVQNNLLTFEDLEPNMWVSRARFTYAPQGAIPVDGDCYLEVRPGGSFNRYQWFLNNAPLTCGCGTDSIQAAHWFGTYFCAVDNDSVPELTLISEEKEIENWTVPLLDLGADTVMCTYPFALRVDAGEAEKYVWENNLRDRYRLITEPGEYLVETSNGNCSIIDTLRVYYGGAYNNDSLTVDQFLCSGEQAAPFEALPSAPGHRYLWQQSINQQDWQNLDSTQNYTSTDSLLQTTYFRRLVFTDSCPDASISQTVTVYVSDIQTNVELTPLTCHGGADGQVELEISGGIAPYSVAYFREVNENWTSYTPQAGFEGGNYEVRVTDSIGCENIVAFTLTEPEPFSFEIEYFEATCNTDLNDAGLRITASGGTPPYRYLWANGERTHEIFDLSPTENGDSTAYTLRLVDSQGCEITRNFYARRRQPIPSSFYFEKDEYCRFEESTSPILEGEAGGFYYAMSEGLALDSLSGEVDLLNSETGEYYVVYQADECSRDTSFLWVSTRCLDGIPNTFTPNADGMNDTWEITMLEKYPSAVVIISDLQGREVFHSERGYPQPWDGKKDGYELPEGAYFFTIRFRDSDIPLEQFQGYISILR